MKTHEDDIYECKTCYKSFKCPYRLKYHSLIHTDQKKECPVEGCAKVFALQSQLNQHLETHTADWNYHCDQCNKKFKVSKISFQILIESYNTQIFRISIVWSIIKCLTLKNQDLLACFVIKLSWNPLYWNNICSYTKKSVVTNVRKMQVYKLEILILM